MKHRIRLGPIAIFLAVIAAVVATLAMLTFATSRADMALAERFAAVTAIRYELDEEGNRFLQVVEETSGKAAEGSGEEVPEQNAEEQMPPIDDALTGETTALAGGGWKYYTEKEGYALTVEVVPAGSESGWQVTKWKINKLWEGDDPFEDLWLG